MYSEDALLPISALQHLLFCERQCALIHIEGLWEENIYTVEGRLLHEKCDSEIRELRGNICIARALPMRSYKLGLIGKADVVEFHRSAYGIGSTVPGLSGSWLTVPVEYKRGRPKIGKEDCVQLCAQAICLEEMLNTHVPKGYIFYGSMKKRCEVVFDDDLRCETITASGKLHKLLNSCMTPAAKYEEHKCDRCSLFDVCLPQVSRLKKNVKQWLEELIVQEEP